MLAYTYIERGKFALVEKRPFSPYFLRDLNDFLPTF